LQKGDPPDVWQTFAGESVQSYARRGVVRSVASVFDSEHLDARMNPTILASLMRSGEPYGVPTGAHRSNVLTPLEDLERHGRIPIALVSRTRAAAPSAFSDLMMARDFLSPRRIYRHELLLGSAPLYPLAIRLVHQNRPGRTGHATPARAKRWLH
jgi:hypothetical protein